MKVFIYTNRITGDVWRVDTKMPPHVDDETLLKTIQEYNENDNNQNQPQQYEPQTWMQEKLLTEEGYMPYCGNPRCREMPRTQFNGKQFYCRCCRWESSYPNEFIEAYKKKWNLR